MEFEEARRYYLALERAKTTKDLAKQHFRSNLILFLLFNLVVLPLYVFSWLKSYIKIDDDLVIVNDLVGVILFINMYGEFNIDMNAQFNIRKVERINILTLTPLIPMRTNIEQINWRDLVIIIYRDDIGRLRSVAIPLFVFPGFKKVVKKIVEANPGVKVSFFKRGLLYDNQSYLQSIINRNKTDF